MDPNCVGYLKIIMSFIRKAATLLTHQKRFLIYVNVLNIYFCHAYFIFDPSPNHVSLKIPWCIIMFIMFLINKIPFLVYPDVSTTFFSSLLEVLTVAQMAHG